MDYQIERNTCSWILLVRDEVQLIQAVLVAKRGIQLTAGKSSRLTGGKCGLA